MTEWEQKRHAIESLQLLKLAIEQARTNTMMLGNAQFCLEASRFESAVDEMSDKLHRGFDAAAIA